MRKTGLTGMVLALFGGRGIAAADIPDPPGTIGAVDSSTAEAGAVDAVAEAYLRPPLAIASPPARRGRRARELGRGPWPRTDRALRRLDPVVADWDDAGIVLVQLWYGRDRGVAVAWGRAPTIMSWASTRSRAPCPTGCAGGPTARRAEGLSHPRGKARHPSPLGEASVIPIPGSPLPGPLPRPPPHGTNGASIERAGASSRRAPPARGHRGVGGPGVASGRRGSPDSPACAPCLRRRLPDRRSGWPGVSRVLLAERTCCLPGVPAAWWRTILPRSSPPTCHPSPSSSRR